VTSSLCVFESHSIGLAQIEKVCRTIYRALSFVVPFQLNPMSSGRKLGDEAASRLASRATLALLPDQ
jgi:hypothetical protein